MFLRECQGVDLSRLPTAAKIGTGPLTAEFYHELFEAIQALGPSDRQWVENKQALGKEIERHLFRPWSDGHSRQPRILATGAGEGWSECVWLEQGFDVTIHDGTPAYFDAIRARAPTAKFIVADMATYVPEGEFDIITMLANDFVLDHSGFVDFLRRMISHLSDGGLVVCFCPSVLSVRRTLIEIVRRLTAYYQRNGWIHWGCWRTPGEFERVARAAGFRVVKALRPGRSGWRELSLGVPPWKESNGLFALEKTT